MSETLNLRFRVFNAGVAAREVEIEHEGQPATLKQRVLHIDAEPLDGTVRTLELELPAALEGKIVIGTVLCASIAFDLPASDEAPAPAAASVADDNEEVDA